MDGGSTTMSKMDEGTNSDAEAAETANASADSSAGPEVDSAEIEPRRVVEAILFASDSPMPAAKVASILGVGDARDVRKHIDDLNDEYADRGMSFRIEEIAGGYQMLTRPTFNTWLTKLLRARQETKLSGAALESLAVVAYKQPCTRADVEAIRGVAAGEMLNRLREMHLIKIVGRAEDLGRPMLYGTTKRFLEVFGLSSLEDLPQVEALSSGAKAEPAKANAGDTEPEGSSQNPEGSPPRLSLVNEDDEAAEAADSDEHK